MRLRLALASLAATAAVVPSASAHDAVCGPAKGHTLAADRQARVYSAGQNVYGCTQATRTRYRLGSTSGPRGEARVGPIALAGTVVAFGRTSYGVDVVSAEVVVEDLIDGRVLRDESATEGNFGPEYAQQVDSIVVKPDASVAWIASVSSVTSPRSVTEVRKSDRTPRTSLARGSDIRLRSLRLHGSLLSWRDGRTRKSARLR